MVKQFIIALLLCLPAFATGHTYYISYSLGNDSNTTTQAQSKSTPWKNLPGCYGGQGTTSGSYTPVSGDSFILYGGDTWPNAALGCGFTATCTSSCSSTPTTSCLGNGNACTANGYVYIGVDKTWPSSGWARPILNGGGTAVNTSTNGVAGTIFRLTANYTIVDNIEITGLNWTGNPNYGNFVNFLFWAGSPGNAIDDVVENVYIHGWSHASYPTANDHACGFVGDTGIPNNNANTILYQDVVDGSDTDEASCIGIFGGPPYIEQTFVQEVSSAAIVNGVILMDSNTFLHVNASFDPTNHENCIEVNAARNFTVSNTLCAHLGTGALGFWSAPYPGYTATWFNDVLFDTDTGNVFDIANAVYTAGNCTQGTVPYCTQSGTTNVYNSTIECGQNSNPNAVCFGGINASTTAVTLQNLHAITNATTPNGGLWSTNGPTPTTSDNIIQTLSAANGQGYNESQTYPFSPTLHTNSTVGAGADLTSTVGASFPGILTDSYVGVSYNATTHTVSWPNRTANNRPSSGAWDSGAYEYSAGSTSGDSLTGVTVQGSVIQ